MKMKRHSYGIYEIDGKLYHAIDLKLFFKYFGLFLLSIWRGLPRQKGQYKWGLAAKNLEVAIKSISIKGFEVK